MKKKRWLKIIIAGLIILIFALVILKLSPSSAITVKNTQPSPTSALTKPTPLSTSTASLLYPPLSNALSRVTKKTFGLYVSPGHSPISPEKFTGYHTGLDFETLPGEAKIDVPVSAVCSGPLIMKKWATGYGGVAVQSCLIDKQAVTIIYGHLRYASITATVGTKMMAGEKFAVLGTGYSSETAGERKHLHLGIHLGTSVNILGYVQNKVDLKNWLDPLKYFK